MWFFGKDGHDFYIAPNSNDQTNHPTTIANKINPISEAFNLVSGADGTVSNRDNLKIYAKKAGYYLTSASINYNNYAAVGLTAEPIYKNVGDIIRNPYSMRTYPSTFDYKDEWPSGVNFLIYLGETNPFA